jgi:hypothetical protein
MTGEINVTNPDTPKKILIVIANPTTSMTLGIPVTITGQQQYSGAKGGAARG